MKELIKKFTGRSGDEIFDKILQGGAVSLFTRIAGIIIGLIAHILLSRSLGASGYGQYAVLISWAMILTCLLYTSPSPRDQRGSRMPSSA